MDPPQLIRGSKAETSAEKGHHVSRLSVRGKLGMGRIS